ncbi:right-handed parallel beta-helix repeat-containing protein [Neisseria yangbaofengii]|uniref:right-handed parallel beta-helix repeat-containing protein n=1 Tax=Neisseria yangbaofengii TaxID=2709396 RepID=UPI0013EAE3CF|nr:right-handed parallel beta-helix repeat-containing protein [Neisseria yangbaofengii]
MKSIKILAGLGGAMAAFSVWATTCTPAQLDEILAQATAQQNSVEVACSATLPKNRAISKRLYFTGEAASNQVFDCNGNMVSPTHIMGGDSMVIRSEKRQNQWLRPENLTIRGCKVAGSVRVMGMGANGEAEAVRLSSRESGHTERAQAAAPSRIRLERMNIVGQGRIPLYLAPGANHVTVADSRITGYSKSVAVYLDAESGYNTFTRNTIDAKTSKRELIAVDGSAHNTFSHNRFSALNHGGIYFYRNCGEGATIRHQTPSYNTLSQNVFYYNKYGGRLPAVWLGARHGNRNYCEADAGYAFGSSLDNRDFADFNVVENNQIYRLPTLRMIRDEGSHNRISENRTVR